MGQGPEEAIRRARSGTKVQYEMIPQTGAQRALEHHLDLKDSRTAMQTNLFVRLPPLAWRHRQYEPTGSRAYKAV